MGQRTALSRCNFWHRLQLAGEVMNHVSNCYITTWALSSAGRVQDRWIIQTRHGTRPWEVIVEPDPLEEVLVVITAYPLSE